MFSIFNGSNEDAYWWILSTESYFKATGKSEMAKMMVAALAMRGEALKWWLWWSHRHPQSDWDTFTTALLWRFKPEWRHLLPVLEEETEEACELSKSAVKLSRIDDCVGAPVTDIAGENNLNPSPCSKLVEKPPITSDLVDSITTDAGEHDLDFPPKLEVQLVQLEIADSIGRIQHRSVIVTTGDKKFSNPALSPQSPKPPDTAFAPPFPPPPKPSDGTFASELDRQPPQAPNLLITQSPPSLIFALPPVSSPPPKPPDRSVVAGIDPLCVHVTLHNYPPPTVLLFGNAENSKHLISIPFPFPVVESPTLELQSPQVVFLFDPGGSQILKTWHFNFYTDVVTNVVLLHWLYDLPVTIISVEIPPPEPPDSAAIPPSDSITLQKFPSPMDLSFRTSVNTSIALLRSLSPNIDLCNIFLGSQLITVSWKNSNIEAKFTIHPFCLACCCTDVVHRLSW